MIERINKRITFMPAVQACVDEGGYVAGGAARALVLRKNMQEYFQTGGFRPTVNPVSVGGMTFAFPHRPMPAGDIDVFFPTHQSLLAARERLKAMGHRSVESALSHTYTLDLQRKSKPSGVSQPSGELEMLSPPFDSVSLQLIKCVVGSPEDMISNFDIVNASVAITHDAILQDTQFSALEDRKVIKIRRADSTQLFKRVVKYMMYRDLQYVDDTTRDMMSEWMIRYVSQNFDGPTSGLSATPGEMNLVDALRIGALDKDHLAYLVGRPEFTRPLYQRESEQGYRLVGKRNVINDIIGKLNSTQEE
jgi:hypothetical protein